MEVTCTRCHQTIQAENCYCPVCGLPQLVYPVEVTSGQTQQQRWDGTERDAGSVDWKPALRAALLLAVPAGLLSSGVSPLCALGLLWLTAAGVWAVVLYMRSQRPAWITIGAGARIGLVTGLLAGWLAFGVSSSALFVQRFLLHQSGQIDAEWKAYVETSQQLAAQMGFSDAAQMQAQKVLMLSPEGHAGFATFSIIFNAAFLLLFAASGGALGARLMNRTRQPEV
jgi:hypothetical protein